MAEIAYSFEDADGNYIQQFQTTAFDARLWELFIYAFLHENQFFIDRGFTAPDYLCQKDGRTIFLEAVTVNPTQGSGTLQVSPESESDRNKLADYAAIKFGSALFSKLSKHYWELEHVKGRPLVFAIADFHQSHSMLWTHPSLWQYLYGMKAGQMATARGSEFSLSRVDEHTYGDKRIPSGFFFQPECENVSAVLLATVEPFQNLIGWGNWLALGILESG